MARRVVKFHSEASSEYLAALDWYRERSPNAARKFESEFTKAVELVRAAPDRWPNYGSGCRRFILRRFPFYIVYRDFDDIVFVIAVAHARRRPGYWKQRVI